MVGPVPPGDVGLVASKRVGRWADGRAVVGRRGPGIGRGCGDHNAGHGVGQTLAGRWSLVGGGGGDRGLVDADPAVDGWGDRSTRSRGGGLCKPARHPPWWLCAVGDDLGVFCVGGGQGPRRAPPQVALPAGGHRADVGGVFVVLFGAGFVDGFGQRHGLGDGLGGLGRHGVSPPKPSQPPAQRADGFVCAGLAGAGRLRHPPRPRPALGQQPSAGD